MKPGAGEEKFKLQGTTPPPHVISDNGGSKPKLTFSISNLKVKNVENGLTPDRGDLVFQPQVGS